MNRKFKLTTVATIAILSILIGPMFFVQTAAAPWVDSSAWYKTVPGVLDTDYYTLYPYKTDKSLKIGFSQFGEMINSIDNVGLEYRDVDPFAPTAGVTVPAAIPKRNWINGWLINITYVTMGGISRSVWACALHADLMDYGGPWLRVDFAGDWSAFYGFEDPLDPGYQIGNYVGGMKYGGRKTNGTAVTEPITVLYHGPRRFVALLNTTIYDHPVFETDDPATDIPLVRILFTIIFDKVKKEVVILKDIKSIAPKLTVLGKMNVQFSNRGEVDLGTVVKGFPSYAHFYVAGNGEGQSTAYDEDWVDVVKTEAAGTKSKHGEEPKTPGTYDVAQIINTATKNVFFAAFWPSLSDWTIFGGALWYRSLVAADPHYTDIPSPPGEPHPTPFYIGEWDFELTDTLGKEIHFRGVTKYGVTDLWDGSDEQMAHGELNVIDKEVKFQLDETFNPWDLLSAVHKETRRWVEFAIVPTVSPWAIVTSAANVPVHVVPDAYWDAYCAFSERIIRLDTGVLLKRGVDYVISLTGPPLPSPLDVPTGQAVIVFLPLHAGKPVKILYSTLPEITTIPPYTHVFGPYTYNGTVNATAPWTAYNFTGTDTWTDILGVKHAIAILDQMMAWNNTDVAETLVDLENASLVTEFKIPEGETKYKAIDVFYDAEVERPEASGLGLNGTIIFTHAITAPNDCSVQMDQTGLIMMNHTVLYDPTLETLNFTVTIGVALTIHEKIMGRYEWLVVGRDSAAVDSAGGAMVSEAFDSRKQIDVWKSGLDTKDMVWGPEVPFMTYEFRPGTGTVEVRPGVFQPSRANYRDAIFKSCSGRSRLLDDWCTEIPVASSNIITIGSSWANHLTEYFNEFTDAYLDVGYGEDGSVMGINPGYIVSLPCWSKNTYKPTSVAGVQTVGYAVISTYKDINGTVGFLVWGWTGQDSFFACEWFWDEGIKQLQLFPAGVTTIILEIDYTAHPPAVSIVECLGTISETLVHGVKGGVHPDP